MRRPLALSLVAASVVMAATAAQAAPGHDRGPTAGYAAQPITWRTCPSPVLRSRNAECGTLTVPLDYTNPRGRTIKLALSRIRHTSTRYQGVMLVNPGGPGGSGLTLSVLGEFVPDGAGASYDWIGFDPRGVGSSEPALTCDGGYFGYNRPAYVPTSPSIERTWLDRSKAYANACATNGGDLLGHLRTTDTIADMESIRKALGVPQINFYGFSYGTYLGQVYATLHPKQVRRMVLDGNVDPRKIWYRANLDQDVAFERNIKIFFDWVARYDSLYHLGTTARAVEATYDEQLRVLKANPAGGRIGPAEWTDIFLPAGYAVFRFPDVAASFAGWVNDKDADALVAAYDDANGQGPGADNGFAIYLAVQCTDAAWPKNWNQWRIDNWATYVRAPFETWGNAWFNAPCAFWKARSGTPVRVDGSKAPPVLLISETLDGATPYEGSLEVRSRFPKASLVEGVGGSTHAGSLNGVACVDDAVAAYLRRGTLPVRAGGRTSDRKCDAIPHPDPTAAARRGAARDITRQDLQRLISPRL